MLLSKACYCLYLPFKVTSAFHLNDENCITCVFAETQVWLESTNSLVQESLGITHILQIALNIFFVTKNKSLFTGSFTLHVIVSAYC